MRKFTKPRSWEEFFIPLQKCSNRYNAVDTIWQMYAYPCNAPNTVNGRNAMVNYAYVSVLPSSINILLLSGSERQYYTLVDYDVFKVTANMIHIAVVIMLFYSRGNIQLTFAFERHRDVVFRAFNTRDFKKADDNYASLKAYIFLLLQDRKLYLDVQPAKKFPKFDYHNTQDIIMQDNFQATLFYHNFITENGYLTHYMRQLHRVLYNDAIWSSTCQYTSMRAQHLSGISMHPEAAPSNEWEKNKLTIFEEMNTVRDAEKAYVYHEAAVLDQPLNPGQQNAEEAQEFSERLPLQGSGHSTLYKPDISKYDNENPRYQRSGINISFEKHRIQTSTDKKAHLDARKGTSRTGESHSAQATIKKARHKVERSLKRRHQVVQSKAHEPSKESQQRYETSQSAASKLKAEPSIAETACYQNTYKSGLNPSSSKYANASQELPDQSEQSYASQPEEPPNKAQTAPDNRPDQKQLDAIMYQLEPQLVAAQDVPPESGRGNKKLMTIKLIGSKAKVLELLQYIPMSLIGGLILKQ